MEEESKLSAVNKETYDSIFLLLDTNLLGAVELFIPGHDGRIYFLACHCMNRGRVILGGSELNGCLFSNLCRY